MRGTVWNKLKPKFSKLMEMSMQWLHLCNPCILRVTKGHCVKGLEKLIGKIHLKTDFNFVPIWAHSQKIQIILNQQLRLPVVRLRVAVRPPELW
jgi:hypothetical protein